MRYSKFASGRLPFAVMSASSGEEQSKIEQSGRPQSLQDICRKDGKSPNAVASELPAKHSSPEQSSKTSVERTGVSFAGAEVAEDRGPSEEQISESVARFARYLREARELYYPQGQGLNEQMKATFKRFFPVALLEQVRIVSLAGRRVENPSFYPEAREMGFTNLPDITHKDSVTFLDALVFNEKLTARNLFHAMVHAAQVRTLGIYLYTDLFVRGFLRTRSYSMVPLKAQAYELDMRFASNKLASFSVEDEIFRWLMEKRF